MTEAPMDTEDETPKVTQWVLTITADAEVTHPEPEEDE